MREVGTFGAASDDSQASAKPAFSDVQLNEDHMCGALKKKVVCETAQTFLLNIAVGSCYLGNTSSAMQSKTLPTKLANFSFLGRFPTLIVCLK